MSALTTLTDDKKRWIVSGIALNNVLVPSIRPILDKKIRKEYDDLKLKHNIHVQTSHSFAHPPYSPTHKGMHYENINANDLKKLKPLRYPWYNYSTFDYKVTSHVDFGKLFLQIHMAKFNAFDETCDAFAVLSLVGGIPVFPPALQTAANVVREGRNAWAHCKFTEWDERNFRKRFDDMKQLVTEVGLSLADESKVLADLKDWEDKGVILCMNASMDPGLVKMVQEQLNRLLSDVENMKSESGEEIRIIQQHLRNFEEEFAGLKREVGVLQQAQRSTDVKVGQLDTNQKFAQQQLISLSGKVDQLTSGQEDLNQNQSSTSVKIDQLQEAFEQSDWEQKGQENRSIDINKLTECNFKGDIQHYYESFHPETRIWLLEKVDRWFERKDSNSQVMILTADAGFGKTTFAAKVCKEYQKTRQLKACHFFNSRYTDRRDPCKMFESLGSQLCKNVNGFKEILDVQLQRNHSRSTIGDAFRVFLKDPLDSLPDEMPNFLIVIDGLDESLSREKEHLLDVIEEEFRKLPKCVKVFITSRPELVTKEKLERLNPVEILRDDEGNKEDLKNYLVSCVSGRYTVDQYDMEEMVKMCEGSFLYAHYYQLELRKLNIVENVLSVVPKGTHSIYQKYFKRLEEELKTVSIDIEFDKILEILVAMQNPFPLSLIANILKLPGSTRTMRAVITKVNECLSALLPVYDDCVTVFHKTVVGWLRADGKYGNHSFSVSLRGAHKTLWQTCRQIFEQLKGAEEVEKQAKKYALENGVDHLWDTTFLLTKNYFEYRDHSLPAIHLKRGKKLFGFGWLVFKDNENVYVMTSNSVVRLIRSDQVDNALEIRVTRGRDKPAYYDATVTNDDFVVVRSNEGNALDYVVLKLKTSRIVQELPSQVSKASFEPGQIVLVPHANPAYDMHISVQPYPEDLVDWLKSSGSSNSSNIPTPSCEPSINFDDAKDLKQIIIAISHVYTTRGLPIFKDLDGEVTGMCSSKTVFINRGKEKKIFGSFAVSMPTIIDDIRRKKPSEAKKWFPNYFD